VHGKELSTTSGKAEVDLLVIGETVGAVHQILPDEAARDLGDGALRKAGMHGNADAVHRLQPSDGIDHAQRSDCHLAQCVQEQWIAAARLGQPLPALVLLRLNLMGGGSKQRHNVNDERC